MHQRQRSMPSSPYNLLPRGQRNRTSSGGSASEVRIGIMSEAQHPPPRRSNNTLPVTDPYPVSSAPTTVNVLGRSLIPPQSSFAKAIVGSGTDNNLSGSALSTGISRQPYMTTTTTSNAQPHSGMSGLSMLLNQQHYEQHNQPILHRHLSNDFQPPPQQPSLMASCEADTASGPPPEDGLVPPLGSSAPGHLGHSVSPRAAAGATRYGEQQLQSNATLGGASTRTGVLARQHSVGATLPSAAAGVHYSGAEGFGENNKSERVRRCLSSKELGTLAPPSGSPYAYMLYEKERLETTMRQRLQRMRETLPASQSNVAAAAGFEQSGNDTSSNNSSRRAVEGANQLRNRRRAEHNQAVVDDLCSVVTDLFIAESKLLKPLQYGVPQPSEHNRELISRCILNFVSCLPTRYALGADTPSEVLLHMRLMTAARADRTKAVVHIHNMQNEDNWTRRAASASKEHHHELRLVTICCNDANGLLEYITKLLATGGSRVLDADVMLSTDGIVLDRFVVEMTGRLRLDKFADLIENFIRDQGEHDEGVRSADSKSAGSSRDSKSSPKAETGGPLYFRTNDLSEGHTPKGIEEEMESAVPLSAVLASSGDLTIHTAPDFPSLRKRNSMPHILAGRLPQVDLLMRREPGRGRGRKPSLDGGVTIICSPETIDPDLMRHQSATDKRQLVNRPRNADLDALESPLTLEKKAPLDYVTITGSGPESGVPLIPFEELMLIEALGTGRVSTIYRAAWRRANEVVQILALKVAMLNIAGDTASVDELRREADIAARLYHPNIVDLIGVAADQECFCLAYDYCEGGSLLGLLSDSRRYYEYLPIALDISNGMAYLHSRNVIHRDLKPSNVLLTRDHRAKIADFGMSVANFGQELTAETGTYRYMAPEVIRHEPYSTNCDVYSFGIVLWQLITREIPFASMTPIQAAYAVAEGRRPIIPADTPRRLQEIIMACWDQDQAKRPSFTYITMALADYAKMAFSPANVGALTLQIANEMLANVEGNSTVNVDFSTPVASNTLFPETFMSPDDSYHSNIGLEIDG